MEKYIQLDYFGSGDIEGLSIINMAHIAKISTIVDKKQELYYLVFIFDNNEMIKFASLDYSELGMLYIKVRQFLADPTTSLLSI